MGETIGKKGAVSDIRDDLQATCDKAAARKGVAATLATERLVPVLGLLINVETQLADARKAAGPLDAELGVANARADKAIGKVSDDIWNDVGRPKSDPALAILFPGGKAVYVEGPVAEQPDKMDLLVELLKANLHPKISATVAQACIDLVTGESTLLRAAVEAQAKSKARILLLERMERAVASAGAMELSHYKRLLKANGFTEADCHTIIPDRGKPTPRAKAPEDAKKTTEAASAPADGGKAAAEGTKAPAEATKTSATPAAGGGAPDTGGGAAAAGAGAPAGGGAAPAAPTGG